MTEFLDQLIDEGRVAASDRGRLARFLADKYGASIGDCLRWTAEQYGLRYSDLRGEESDSALLARFPAAVLWREELLPLRQTDLGIELATAALFRTEGLDALRRLAGEELIPVVVPEAALREALKSCLGIGADTLDSLGDRGVFASADADTGVDLEEAAHDATIIRFVNQIFTDAIRQRATDIHLEPFEDEFRVRYRIDGVLQDVSVPATMKRYQPAIVSRIKILANLDIAENRLPQDGRVKLRLAGNHIEVRVSVIPMLHGEAVVIGVLMEDQETREVRKVPLLGDIPVLGVLFWRTIIEKSKTELLIFLTPHVVTGSTADSLVEMEKRAVGIAESVDGDKLRRYFDSTGGTSGPAIGTLVPRP